MPSEPRPQSQNNDARTTDAQPGQQRDTGRQDQRETTTPPHGQPDSIPPARESDPAAGRDLPDENGEPPSVKRPGNPDASEPPVENF